MVTQLQKNCGSSEESWQFGSQNRLAGPKKMLIGRLCFFLTTMHICHSAFGMLMGLDTAALKRDAVMPPNGCGPRMAMTSFGSEARNESLLGTSASLLVPLLLVAMPLLLVASCY